MNTTTHECRVRLFRGPYGYCTIGITSPRTGLELTLPCVDVLGRLRGKVVKAVSEGRHVASLSVEDLQSFARSHRMSHSMASPPP